MQDILGPSILWYIPPDEPIVNLVCSDDLANLGDSDSPNSKITWQGSIPFMSCPECKKFFSKPVDDLEDWMADENFMFDEAGNYVATRVAEVE